MVSTHTVSYGKWCILIDDNLQNFKVRRKHIICQSLGWLWSPSGPQRIKRVGGRVGRNPRQGGRLLAEEVENHWNFFTFLDTKAFFQVSAELHRRWCNVGNRWVFYHTNIIWKKKYLFGGIYTKIHCILHRPVEDTMLSQQTYVSQVFWRQTQ